jgi:inhibitor of cysteine peptidase
MAEIAVGEGQNTSNLAASVGDEIRLELPENPTTGFRWQLGAIDDSILQLRTDDFVPATGAAIGGGGRRLFRWAALRSGVTDVRLELKRPWEAAAPRSTYGLRISVR